MIAIVGARSRSGPHEVATVARVVTAVMTELRVPRLAITSAHPVTAVTPRLPLAILRRVFAEACADVRTMEQVFTGSELDWRIVRLNRPRAWNDRVSGDNARSAASPEPGRRGRDVARNRGQ